MTAKRVTIGHEYRDGIVAYAIGTLDLSVLGAEIMEDLRAARTLVVMDVVSDHRTRERSLPASSDGHTLAYRCALGAAGAAAGASLSCPS